MAKVLIAWELGGGLNHLMRARALSEALDTRGHAVYAALRDVTLRQHAVWPPNSRLLPAPHAMTVRLMEQPSTYADILCMNGWHDAATLSGLVAAWGTLLELIEPAVVVVDHAPTAALVARLGEIPVVRMGMGFFAPPPMQPLPIFRLSDAAPLTRLAAAETVVLRTVNAVAQTCGVAFDSLAEALAPQLDLLTCWPELDHYAGQRPTGSARFVGPERIITPGPALTWPSEGAPRVLAYLNAASVTAIPLLQALDDAGAATVAYLADPTGVALPAQPTPRRVMCSSLFDPDLALAACDVFVGHAANGMTHAALAAGKPVLMVPMTAEQELFAHRLEALGAGAVLPRQLDARSLATLLRAAVDPTGMASRARTLAAQHAQEPDGLAVGAQAILDLLAESVPPEPTFSGGVPG